MGSTTDLAPSSASWSHTPHVVQPLVGQISGIQRRHAVSLNGWHLKDRANRTWTLFGTLEAGAERTFTRDGQSMALNNNGDTVALIDDGGNVVDSVSYQTAQEGKVLDASNLR